MYEYYYLTWYYYVLLYMYVVNRKQHIKSRRS